MTVRPARATSATTAATPPWASASSATSSNSFDSISFAIHRDDSGSIATYSDANFRVLVKRVDPDATETRCRVHFDGVRTVRYYVDDVHIDTQDWPYADPLYFTAALASANPRLDDITLTAAGTKGIDGRDGVNGTNGVPGRDGVNGANGTSAFFHVAYANSADGSADFTTGDPGARRYIGVLVDQAPADSGDYRAYTWSLIRGADGLNGANGTPGAPGANGQASYVHFAYANSPDGSADFSVDQPAGRQYIGVYSDFVVADSGDYRAYSWSLVKGADGFSVQTETPFFAIPAFSSGASKPSWTGGTGTIRLIKGGARIVSGVIYGVHSAVNIAGLSHDGSERFSFSGLTGDAGWFYIRATYNGQLYDLRIDVKKVLDGSAAFRSEQPFSASASAASGSGNTTVPQNRTVTLSAYAYYTARSPGGGQTFGATGYIDVYWRNLTDAGPDNYLGRITGSNARTTNRGSNAEPDYEEIPGEAAGSFQFTSPSPDKQIAYRADFSSGGSAGFVAGNVALEIR